jgi:plasmid stabilization system protein ParE
VILRRVFRAAARREYDLALAWYADRRPGLGERFAASVDAALDRVSSAPGRFPVAVAIVRWVRVAGFPYRVYFRVSRSRIEVFAVFHVRRDPALLMRR